MLDRDYSEKPFQIFSSEEIKQLNSYNELIPNTKTFEVLKSNLKNLSGVCNGATHQWYKKISETLQQLDVKEINKEEIKEGMARYLEDANRLQRPKLGEIRKWTSQSTGQVIEREVNVYEAFWDNCYEALIHAFLAATSKISSESLSQDKAKSLIYGLMRFKKHTLSDIKLSDGKITRLKTTIDQLIEGIISKSHLHHFFLVTDETAQFAHEIMNDVVKRYLALLDLKMAFEAEPYYAKYVHMRPAVLIQIAQLIKDNDCLIKTLLEDQQKKLYLFKNRAAEQALEKCLAMLDNKRKEMTNAIYFQEKLYTAFNMDDFLEILHFLVKNIGAGLLPIQSFFQFDEKQMTKVVQYLDEETLEIPISLEKRHRWRLNYLDDPELTFDFKFTQVEKWQKKLKDTLKNNLAMSDKHALRQENVILPTEFVKFIDRDNILLLQIPACILPYCVKQTFIPSDPIYDFFIHNHEERNKLFTINEDADIMAFLFRQVSQHKKLDALFMVDLKGSQDKKDLRFFLSPGPQGTYHNFSCLIKIIERFNARYFIELNLLKEARKQCKNDLHIELFDRYKASLETSYAHFTHTVKTILDYWTNELATDKKYQYIINSDALHSFKKLVEDALRALNNKPYLKITEKSIACTLKQKYPSNLSL